MIVHQTETILTGLTPLSLPEYESGKTPVYTCVMALEVPCNLGDTLTIDAEVTVNARDRCKNWYGTVKSVFVPSMLTIHTSIPPADGKLHGTRAGSINGENTNASRPYYVVRRRAVVEVDILPCVVCLWLYPTSEAARPGDYLVLPLTGHYHQMIVRQEVRYF